MGDHCRTFMRGVVMAYKEVFRVEILEVIGRWQMGESRRQIASGTGLSKDTVGKYISAAEGLGVFLDGPAPGEEQLSQLAAISRSGPRQPEAPTEDKLAPWADQIYQWLTGDRLQLTRVQELLSARGCAVSYASLQRFVQRRNWRRRNSATVRMEDSTPGEVVELDFGPPGPDPRSRYRPPPCRVGPDPGAGLFAALFRLAHFQPEAGGRDRRSGVGLVFLRRHPQVNGAGQFPGGTGRS